MSSSSSSLWVPLSVKRQALALIRTPQSHHHKGSSGRIVVLGGSRDYVGAPYFAAMGALRGGVDMATIVTTSSAAGPLKAMSPDLIVRGIIPPPPHYHLSNHSENAAAASSHQKSISEFATLLSRSHSLIIGPGLATDTAEEICPLFVDWLKQLVSEGRYDKAKEKAKVVDAHGRRGDAGANDRDESNSNDNGDNTLTATAPIHCPLCIIDASGIPLLADALASRWSTTSSVASHHNLQHRIILTPNINEVGILYRAVVSHLQHEQKQREQQQTQQQHPPTADRREQSDEVGAASTRSTTLPPRPPSPPASGKDYTAMALYVSYYTQCCVLMKGAHDYVAMGGVAYGHVGLGTTTTTEEGEAENGEDSKRQPCSVLSPCARRVAGQGDILSGLVGAFLAWASTSSPSSTAMVSQQTKLLLGNEGSSNARIITPTPQLVLCAVGASLAMKHSARATEAAMGSSRFVTSDILQHVGKAVDGLAAVAAIVDMPPRKEEEEEE